MDTVGTGSGPGNGQACRTYYRFSYYGHRQWYCCLKNPADYDNPQRYFRSYFLVRQTYDAGNSNYPSLVPPDN